MKKILLSLFMTSASVNAQPVDLLQQLYGNRVSAPASPSPQGSGEARPVISEPLTLTVRDSYSISRERLFLSDVATCKGPKKACDEISAIDLGSAPKALRQDRMPKTKIVDAVQREAGDVAIVWTGAEHCLITALASPINEEAVVRLLQHEFESAPKGMRIIIQSIRVPTVQVLRHSNYIYKIQGYTDQFARVYTSPRTRFAQIKITAVDQDPASQANIEFIVQVNLRVEVQALVTTGTRERGERITADLVSLEWIPFQDQIVTDEKLLVGKLLRSRVIANQALRTWDLTREPEVLRGDRIEAIMSNGGVSINSKAQALEPGFIGQKIRIRLEATKKTMLATVTARSQVEVNSL